MYHYCVTLAFISCKTSEIVILLCSAILATNPNAISLISLYCFKAEI